MDTKIDWKISFFNKNNDVVDIHIFKNVFRVCQKACVKYVN